MVTSPCTISFFYPFLQCPHLSSTHSLAFLRAPYKCHDSVFVWQQCGLNPEPHTHQAGTVPLELCIQPFFLQVFFRQGLVFFAHVSLDCNLPIPASGTAGITGAHHYAQVSDCQGWPPQELGLRACTTVPNQYVTFEFGLFYLAFRFIYSFIIIYYCDMYQKFIPFYY